MKDAEKDKEEKAETQPAKEKDWHPKYDGPANFKKDFIDTGIIESVHTYSFGKMPVVALRQVRAAAGALKGSCTCGFIFKSKTNTEIPEFKLVFCAKPRSKIYRRDVITRARWYGMTVTRSTTRFDILSKKTIYQLYGFDIDRFFQTPEFQKSCEVFQKLVLNGLKDSKAFVDDYKQKCKDAKNITTELPSLKKKLSDAKRLKDGPHKEEKIKELTDRISKLEQLKTNKFEPDPTDDGNMDEWLVAISEAAALLGKKTTNYEDANYFYDDEQKIINMIKNRGEEASAELADKTKQHGQEMSDASKNLMNKIVSNPYNSTATHDMFEESLEDLPANIQKRYNDLFAEHVPASGAAKTYGGELLRAISRIGYRWYNDGDKVFNWDEGDPSTVNPAWRWISKNFVNPTDEWGYREQDVLSEADAKEFRKYLADLEMDHDYEKTIDNIVKLVVGFFDKDEYKEILEKPLYGNDIWNKKYYNRDEDEQPEEEEEEEEEEEDHSEEDSDNYLEEGKELTDCPQCHKHTFKIDSHTFDGKCTNCGHWEKDAKSLLEAMSQRYDAINQYKKHSYASNKKPTWHILTGEFSLDNCNDGIAFDQKGKHIHLTDAKSASTTQDPNVILKVANKLATDPYFKKRYYIINYEHYVYGVQTQKNHARVGGKATYTPNGGWEGLDNVREQDAPMHQTDTYAKMDQQAVSEGSETFMCRICREDLSDIKPYEINGVGPNNSDGYGVICPGCGAFNDWKEDEEFSVIRGPGK